MTEVTCRASSRRDRRGEGVLLELTLPLVPLQAYGGSSDCNNLWDCLPKGEEPEMATGPILLSDLFCRGDKLPGNAGPEAKAALEQVVLRRTSYSHTP